MKTKTASAKKPPDRNARTATGTEDEDNREEVGKLVARIKGPGAKVVGTVKTKGGRK